MLTVLIFSSCASIRPTGMGERTYLVPDGVKLWESKECEVKLVKLTHAAIKAGVTSPGMVMYYFRCRGPNDYQTYLRGIKNRWRPIKGRRR